LEQGFNYINSSLICLVFGRLWQAMTSWGLLINDFLNWRVKYVPSKTT
jgi:hypothetical protein